ncbi:MAG: hypothetical protein ACI9F9_001125 [Candidatus Paceibacteria bacterium]|jgi:hypothetical protein
MGQASVFYDQRASAAEAAVGVWLGAAFFAQGRSNIAAPLSAAAARSNSGDHSRCELRAGSKRRAFYLTKDARSSITTIRAYRIALHSQDEAQEAA